MAFIASQLCPENLNRERVLEMCIVHDLAEVRVGDITPYDNITSSDKKALEFEAFESMEINPISRELFIEYESQKTPESRFVRFVDKLDMALQAEIYEGADLFDDLDLSEFKKTAIILASEYGFEW
jgi:putative hydrolase of HD superfamily